MQECSPLAGKTEQSTQPAALQEAAVSVTIESYTKAHDPELEHIWQKNRRFVSLPSPLLCQYGILKEHNRVIGYIAYRYDTPEKKTGTIKALAVSAEKHKQGHGKRLILYAIMQLQNQGAQTAELGITHANKKAFLFYRSMDFEVIEEDNEWKRNNLIGMRKIFDSSPPLIPPFLFETQDN
jgi:ribosomal protein S18 acetylase RimI-like enzyme